MTSRFWGEVGGGGETDGGGGGKLNLGSIYPLVRLIGFSPFLAKYGKVEVQKSDNLFRGIQRASTEAEFFLVLLLRPSRDVSLQEV